MTYVQNDLGRQALGEAELPNPATHHSSAGGEQQRGRSNLDKLLDAIEGPEQDANKISGRESVRHKFRAKLTIDVYQPGGNKTSHQVVVRNLSSNGLSFIHSGFLHHGTKCCLQLTTLDGAWENISANVVRCRLIKGRVHEIGLHFLAPINLEDFLHQSLAGRILIVEDDPGYAKLITHQLAKSGREVVLADRGFKALKLVKDGHFSVILTDHEMPGMTGTTLVKQLRETGITIPIIMMSANTSDAFRDLALEAGCDKFLPKPVRKEELLAAIDESQCSAEVLKSDFADNPDMIEFID